MFFLCSFSEKFAQLIKVTGDFNFSPYSFLDKEGVPSGMDIEILNELEQILDMQFEVYLTEWDSAILYLKAGKAEAITGIIYSEERERGFDFTIPLNTKRYSIFARKDIKQVLINLCGNALEFAIAVEVRELKRDVKSDVLNCIFRLPIQGLV